MTGAKGKKKAVERGLFWWKVVVSFVFSSSLKSEKRRCSTTLLPLFSLLSLSFIYYPPFVREFLHPTTCIASLLSVGNRTKQIMLKRDDSVVLLCAKKKGRGAGGRQNLKKKKLSLSLSQLLTRGKRNNQKKTLSLSLSLNPS